MFRVCIPRCSKVSLKDVHGSLLGQKELQFLKLSRIEIHQISFKLLPFP
jgi:hypothetical protein